MKAAILTVLIASGQSMTTGTFTGPPLEGEILKPVDMGAPPIFKNKLRFQQTQNKLTKQPSFDPHSALHHPLSSTQKTTLDVAMRESGIAPAHVVLHHAPQSLPTSIPTTPKKNLRASLPPLDLEQQVSQHEALMQAMSERAAVGAPQLQPLSTTVLLETNLPSQTTAIDKCFGGASYSATLNVAGLSSIAEAKEGMDKLFDILPMAFSLLGSGSVVEKITARMPDIATVLCSSVVPPTTATCTPSLACNDGCLDIQQTLLNDDIRGQLGMVGPNGPMRNIIESMVTGPALVILDRALEVLQDPNCLTAGAFEKDKSTCIDTSKYTASVCDPTATVTSRASTMTTAPVAPIVSASVSTAPVESVASVDNVDNVDNAPLTGTQIMMGNVVEGAVGKAKNEIGSLIPKIEEEIVKQEEEMEHQLESAEKGLTKGMNVSKGYERTMNILENHPEDENEFTLNETHKLQLLDQAYTTCEKYKQVPVVADLFHGVEEATSPKTKHEYLIRLREECEELQNPTKGIIVQESEEPRNMSNNTNATKNETTIIEPPTPIVLVPTVAPVKRKTMEEQVNDIENELKKSSDIEAPYDKNDDTMINDLLNKYPRGNRAKYNREQYKWMKEAHAGSAAVRQFSQFQPRYNSAWELKAMNGTVFSNGETGNVNGSTHVESLL